MQCARTQHARTALLSIVCHPSGRFQSRIRIISNYVHLSALRRLGLAHIPHHVGVFRVFRRDLRVMSGLMPLSVAERTIRRRKWSVFESSDRAGAQRRTAARSLQAIRGVGMSIQPAGPARTLCRFLYTAAKMA